MGAHLPNLPGNLSAEDIEKFKEGRFDGALLFDYTPPTVAQTLGISPANCLVRLRDSIYRHADGSTYIPSWWDYADDAIETIVTFYPYGYRRFILSNEDNLTWGSNMSGVAAWFYGMVIWQIRTELKNRGLIGVELGSPPLSAPSDYLDWWYAMRPVRAACDFVTAHAYWQGSRYAWGQFGREYLRLKNFMEKDFEPMKPIYVTECGTSDCQRTIPPTREELDATMSADYTAYIELCRNDGVLGIYFFILSSNPDWTGFNLTDTVCRSIGARRDHKPGGGGGAGTARTV